MSTIPKLPRLIVGLGNPGEEYEDTYHNVGFRVVDGIAKSCGVRIREQCGPALISSKVVVGGQDAVLVLPQTYMNRTASAFPKLFERFEVDCSSLVIIYDDIALPLGKLRIRQKGSAGGHNGVKSVISVCGTDEFLRVRVGILPERPIENLRDFVLSRVAKRDREYLDQAEEIAQKAVETVIASGLEPAMAAFNGIDLRETIKED
jgi:PTH1 family peptidyl-tRNA hydrolase